MSEQSKQIIGFSLNRDRETMAENAAEKQLHDRRVLMARKEHAIEGLIMLGLVGILEVAIWFHL